MSEASSCKVTREPVAVHSRATVSPVRRGRLTLTSFIHWETSTERARNVSHKSRSLRREWEEGENPLDDNIFAMRAAVSEYGN